MKPYYEMSRNRQVKRQWGILKHLAANRYATFETIADEFGCSQKSIRRDIAALEEVGFPISRVTNADGGGKFIRLDRNWLDLHSNNNQRSKSC